MSKVQTNSKARIKTASKTIKKKSPGRPKGSKNKPKSYGTAKEWVLNPVVDELPLDFFDSAPEATKIYILQQKVKHKDEVIKLQRIGYFTFIAIAVLVIVFN
jgi:hypothetical protein